MRGGTTSSTPGAASDELRSERAPQGEATPGEDAPPDAPGAAEDTRAPTTPRPTRPPPGEAAPPGAPGPAEDPRAPTRPGPSRSRMWAGRALGLASVFIGTAT